MSYARKHRDQLKQLLADKVPAPTLMGRSSKYVGKEEARGEVPQYGLAIVIYRLEDGSLGYEWATFNPFNGSDKLPKVLDFSIKNLCARFLTPQVTDYAMKYFPLFQETFQELPARRIVDVNNVQPMCYPHKGEFVPINFGAIWLAFVAFINSYCRQTDPRRRGGAGFDLMAKNFLIELIAYNSGHHAFSGLNLMQLTQCRKIYDPATQSPVTIDLAHRPVLSATNGFTCEDYRDFGLLGLGTINFQQNATFQGGAISSDISTVYEAIIGTNRPLFAEYLSPLGLGHFVHAATVTTWTVGFGNPAVRPIAIKILLILTTQWYTKERKLTQRDHFKITYADGTKFQKELDLVIRYFHQIATLHQLHLPVATEWGRIDLLPLLERNFDHIVKTILAWGL